MAEEWLRSITELLNFMELNDQQKVMCTAYVLTKDARFWWDTVKAKRDVSMMTWLEFVKEFNEKYYNRATIQTYRNEFNKLKQGSLSVAEVVQKFERLSRFCPSLVPDEEEKVKKLMDIFRPEISKFIDAGGNTPTTAMECISRALRAEYHENQCREERAARNKANNMTKTQGSQDNQRNFQNQNPNRRQGNFHPNRKRSGNFQPQHSEKPSGKRQNNGNNNNGQNMSSCVKCGKNHPGECKLGTSGCYKCGRDGHKAKFCPESQPAPVPSATPKLPAPRIHAIEARPESQFKPEGAEPSGRIYTYTRDEATAGTSEVVTGQLLIANT